MQRCFIRLSTVIACRSLKDVPKLYMTSCLSVGTKILSRGQPLRRYNGSLKTSSPCLIPNTGMPLPTKPLGARKSSYTANFPAFAFNKALTSFPEICQRKKKYFCKLNYLRKRAQADHIIHSFVHGIKLRLTKLTIEPIGL